MTDEQKTSFAALETCRRAVRARLARVRRRLRMQLFVEGVAWETAAAVLLVAVSILIDRFLRPEPAVRWTLLAISVAALVYVAVRRLYRPVALKLDDLDLAELLERRQQGIGQQLTNVLQLPHLLHEDPSASPAMIQSAVREDFAALEQVDLHSTFDPQRRRYAWLSLVGLTALAVGFCAVNPAMASLWARRWFAGANIRWPQATYLSVIGLGDGDRIQVPRGEAALLQVEAQPEFTPWEKLWRLNGRGEALLVESPEKPASKIPESISLKLALADGNQRLGTFTHFSGGQFRYELPPLTAPAEITITGGDDWFGPIRIEPIDRPAVERLTVTARSPGKSELDIFQADDAQQQLLFLPSTQLELELTTSQPLRSARVVISGTDAGPDLTQLDEHRYRLTWEMKEAVTFEFQLVGESGLNSKPHFLTVGLLNDRPPRLTLRSSGVGRRVTPVARVPIHLRVIDDFGIANLSLDLEATRIVDSKPVTAEHQPVKETFEIAEGKKLPTDVERTPQVELKDFELTPGITLRLRGKASDACVMGMQSAESRWLTFQVVSAEELFYEILTRQREQRHRFEKALETAKGQLDSLNVIAAPSEAGQLIRVHQGVTRQVWQVAGQLDATLQEMTLNDLGSGAARDLLEKTIIQPLRELHERPLAELRSKLDGLLGGDVLNEERREAAIAAQTEVVQQMRRIFDQMSQWESFVDVVNQLRHVITVQEQIRESTEETQKKQIKGVFEDE